MTLLLSSPAKIRKYREKGSMLRLTTHGMTETKHGFEVETLRIKRQDRPNPVRFVDPQSRLGGDLPASRARYASSEGTDSLRRLDNHADNDLDSRHANKKQPTSPQEAADMSRDQKNADREWQHIDADGNVLRESHSVIYHLIVTVKTPLTVNAIRPYAHRLTPQSTILFLQNGMGIIDEVNKELFPSEDDRPHYMVGILSHGLYTRDSFDVIHAGDGTIALGLLTEGTEYPESARFLLRTITRTPVFVAMGLNPRELFQQQLDKLAVNAVINPLTVLLDCLNGELLDNFYVVRVMRMLLAEISVVFQSLPELQNVLNVSMRFDTARLESMVIRVARLTGRNRSSMLQDVRAGKQTEIDYINGYIIKRGEELGIHCMTHYAIMQIIKAKSKMIGLEQPGVALTQPSGRRE